MDLGSVLKEFAVKIAINFDQKGAESAKASVEQIGKSLKEVSIHVAEASAAIFEMANISGEHSRKLDEESKQLGITTDSLQQLQYASKVAANVSGDELNGALQALSATMFQVRIGNQSAMDSLNRLGVPLDKVANGAIGVDDVFKIVADRIQSVKDPMLKLGLANQLGGSTLVKLIPLLNQGSLGFRKYGDDAKKSGLILDEYLIKKGAEFDVTLSRVWLALKNLTYTIGAELIKVLVPLVAKFEMFIIQNKKFIALGVAAVMKNLGIYVSMVFKVVSLLVDGMKKLIDAFGGVNKVSKVLFISLGLIAGAKILWSVGKLVSLVRLLNIEMIKSAAATLIAEAPFFLIGAAIAGLILIIQDIYTYAQGGDSVFGKIVDNMSGWVAAIKSFLQPVLDIFNKVFAFGMQVGGMINKMFAPGVINTVSDFFKGGVANIENTLGFKPANAPGTTSSENTTNQKNEFNNDFTIMVPPGTGAQQASSIVSAGTSQAFENVLRQTRNQALGGVAY